MCDGELLEHVEALLLFPHCRDISKPGKITPAASLVAGTGDTAMASPGRRERPCVHRCPSSVTRDNDAIDF